MPYTAGSMPYTAGSMPYTGGSIPYTGGSMPVGRSVPFVGASMPVGGYAAGPGVSWGSPMVVGQQPMSASMPVFSSQSMPVQQQQQRRSMPSAGPVQVYKTKPGKIISETIEEDVEEVRYIPAEPLELPPQRFKKRLSLAEFEGRDPHWQISNRPIRTKVIEWNQTDIMSTSMREFHDLLPERVPKVWCPSSHSSGQEQGGPWEAKDDKSAPKNPAVYSNAMDLGGIKKNTWEKRDQSLLRVPFGVAIDRLNFVRKFKERVADDGYVITAFDEEMLAEIAADPEKAFEFEYGGHNFFDDDD